MKWTKGALEDLVELTRFIAADDPGTARRVASRLRERSRSLRRFPEMGRMVPEVDDAGIRELVMPPFRLVYAVGADRVEILAVIHSRQELMPTELRRD